MQKVGLKYLLTFYADHSKYNFNRIFHKEVYSPQHLILPLEFVGETLNIRKLIKILML